MKTLMMTTSLAVLALAVSCAGAPMKAPGSGPATGFESPNIVGQAMVHAWNSGISREIDDLFPTHARLRALLECSDAVADDLLDRPINAAKQELKDHAGGNHFEYVGGDIVKAETAAAGTQDDGCTFKVDVPSVDYKIRFKRDGEPGDAHARFVKVGGVWYLFSL